MRNITRRDFITQAARAAALLELTRQARWFAPSLVSAESLPEVAVAQGTNADSGPALLQTALEGLGGIGRFVKPGQVVCIKPNATWAYPPGTASSTDPEVLRTLIQMVKDAGAKKIVLVDHCTLDPGAAECLRVTGIGKMLEAFPDVERVWGDRFQSPPSWFVDVEFPHGKAFKNIPCFKAAVEADVRINMAVPKSHWVTRFTLCLKHIMGYMQWPTVLHSDLEQGIADSATASAVFSQLHILEAIRVRLPVPGREQAGGSGNEISDPQRVKRVNEIVVGTDPVLIDAYGFIKYFGRQPKELAHIKIAGEMGLGEMDTAKATKSGRLRFYTVGQPIATPLPTATSTATLTLTPPLSATAGVTKGEPTQTPSPAGPTATPTIPPTQTPLPTPTDAPQVAAIGSDAPPPFSEELPRQATGEVLSPNPLLNGALVPAAAIVTGLGLILRRRTQKSGAEGEE